MKDRSKKTRLSLGIGMFFLLFLYLVFCQCDTGIPMPCLFDCPSIENAGERNPLADDEKSERLSAQIFYPGAYIPAISFAAKISHLCSQTSLLRQSGFILRC
jgi:hypothetical protein